MKRGYAILLLFSIILLATGVTYAASGRCKVTRVDGSTVVLQCDRTEGFAQGKEVKIKTTRPQQQ